MERNGLAESEEEGDEENLYFSKEILTTILNQWMGIYPLWSGILLGDLRRYDKTGNLKADEPVETRSTNSLVENYFGILKMNIPKRTRLRPGEFVRRQYKQAKGKLAEIETIQPTAETGRKKAGQQDQEMWKPKRDRSKKKSKYFTPPINFPKPKKPVKRKLEFPPKDSVLDESSKSQNEQIKDHKLEPESKRRKTSDLEKASTSQTTQSVNTEKSRPQKVAVNLSSLLGNAPSWGGSGNHRDAEINLSNTCPLDNMLYILYITLKDTHSGNLLLTEDSPLQDIMRTVYEHMDNGDWFKAKISWIDHFCPQRANPTQDNGRLVLNLFESEYALFVQHLQFLHKSSQITRCSDKDCPLKYKRVESPHITLP